MSILFLLVDNILFDSFIPCNAHWLSAALDFYSRLNKMDDRELAACDFSRKEIGEGLNDILRLSGLEALKIE